MKCFLPLAALLSVALAGHSQVAVRLPFLNPAGVTYVGGPAPAGLAAGPAYAHQLAYAANPAFAPAVTRQSTIHGNYGSHFAYHAAPVAHHVAQPLASVHHVAQPLASVHHVAQPLASVHHVAQPLASVHHVAQPVAAVHHVAQPVSAAVHHVPAVANVPVTHYEATHGVVQKVVDVAHPAVSTRKFHVRRPAIQKQFYDIEERVVVRPAGSALVELDEPISKVQKGGAVIGPALHHPLPAVRVFPAYKAYHTIPITGAHFPTHTAPSAPAEPTNSAPTDAFPTNQPSQETPKQDSFDDSDDSVSVNNPEFRSAINDDENQGTEQQNEQTQQDEQQGEQQGVERDEQQGQEKNQEEEQQQEKQQQNQMEQDETDNMQAQQQQRSGQNNDQGLLQRSGLQFQFQDSRQFQSEREQFNARQFNFAALAQQQQFNPDPIPEQDSLQARSQDSQSSSGQTEVKFQSRQLETDGRSVFPSLRNLDSASSRANQQRLIELLTARGGVAEVGFGRQGPASGINVEAGGVRARVISATPAPQYADAAGERVSTRRVVVSRPVETLQELDVVEPVTKLQRVAVNTPTIFKTARLGVARVATSVPVIQKTYAHPAPLLYRKTYAHAPALTYY